MGGMHVHLRIRFATGESWLARIPRQNFMSFSDGFTNSIVLSECGTLKQLAEMDVVAPRLYGHGLRNGGGGHGVGVAYMLIDELPGQPLDIYGLTNEQKAKVYDQLAVISQKISMHPFRSIGSLTLDSEGNVQIGPVTGDRTGTLSYIGPFENAVDYHCAWAEEYLRLIAEGQLFSDYPVDAYLIFKYLGMLASQGRWNPCETEHDAGPFFLKHMDDKGDHIMVDDEFNITGIIDWTFARVVPAYEAFGPSLVTADTTDLFEDNPGLSEDDKALASAIASNGMRFGSLAKSNDAVRRYSFALGMGMNVTWDEAMRLFEGILKTSGDYCHGFEWDSWRSGQLIEWADDERLAKLLLRP